ncbi:MAG: class I SAM-dependent methyltransferase [Chlamydiia bacterium]|nr:class I SAM-dependent methyltransferase [Chlamydiia bacterium]MCB1114851.1 class I SAM-dependent methyltransferase [Chlamydiia bacterium]
MKLFCVLVVGLQSSYEKLTHLLAPFALSKLPLVTLTMLSVLIGQIALKNLGVIFSKTFVDRPLACTSLFGGEAHETIFTHIYNSAPWNASGFSLSGSQVGVTREYMDFLQEFLKENNIKTVVDLGCGDWAFSRFIDWTGIEYIGYDVVKYVIERNQELFSAPNIHFIHADILETDLPTGDLLICKDVFQHLPNSEIVAIASQFHKFKHCLITNYICAGNEENKEIFIGFYRPVDLTKPPFNAPGEKVLHFFSGVAFKETLHIRN